MPRAARVAHSLSLVHSWFVGGLRPRGPPDTLACGGPGCPAPLAWLTRCRSFTHGLLGDFVPADPLTARLRGPRMPRAARVAHSLPLVRSLFFRGTSSPRTP